MSGRRRGPQHVDLAFDVRQFADAVDQYADTAIKECQYPEEVLDLERWREQQHQRVKQMMFGSALTGRK
jgi:hypothetical protein